MASTLPHGRARPATRLAMGLRIQRRVSCWQSNASRLARCAPWEAAGGAAGGQAQLRVLGRSCLTATSLTSHAYQRCLVCAQHCEVPLKLTGLNEPDLRAP